MTNSIDWKLNHKNPLVPLTDDLPEWFKFSKTDHAMFSFVNDTLYWLGGTFYSNWEAKASYPSPDRVWVSGAFQGLSFKGVWHNGYFRGHTFQGTWHDGNFNGEIFIGTWNKGTFSKGVCQDSNWYNGTFEGSKFLKGFWFGGHFFQGEFVDSNFYYGSFDRMGVFINSQFHAGEFYGTFKSGNLNPAFCIFAATTKWEDEGLDKLSTLAAISGVLFDDKGFGIAYRKTRAGGHGCYNPRYVQEEGEFEITDAAPKGSGTCREGLHACGPLLALTYFEPSPGDILWEVKFHKDDLLDCDGQKLRLKKGTARKVPWSFLTKDHLINSAQK